MQNPIQTFQRITTTIDNGKTIISTAEIIIKDTPEQKLYDIIKQDQVWTVISHECKGGPQVITTDETDETISQFIETLVNKFNNGRILNASLKKGWYTYRTCPNAFTRKLKRQQVQKILRYERDGTPRETQIEAVTRGNPTLLPSSKDFGDYALDTWSKGSKKKGYYYTTFDPTMKRHLDKLIYKY